MTNHIAITARTVRAAVRDFGLSFRAYDGEYRVAPSPYHPMLACLPTYAARCEQSEALASYTTDLLDCLAEAESMASYLSRNPYKA